jgi:hypothetical protein
MPAAVTPGTYRLAIGVEDAWKHQRTMRFANRLPVIDGYTVLDPVTVVK